MTSGSLAIDGSGLWSWSVGRRAAATTEDEAVNICDARPDDLL
jgi:hypothetical protein